MYVFGRRTFPDILQSDKLLNRDRGSEMLIKWSKEGRKLHHNKKIINISHLALRLVDGTRLLEFGTSLHYELKTIIKFQRIGKISQYKSITATQS